MAVLVAAMGFRTAFRVQGKGRQGPFELPVTHHFVSLEDCKSLILLEKNGGGDGSRTREPTNKINELRYLWATWGPHLSPLR